MTREELYKIAKHYAQDELKDSHSAVEDVVAAAFIDGVNYADTHPQWISVDDELPPKDGRYLFYDEFLGPRVSAYYVECTLVKEITHWLPLPQPPKKGGEIMERLTVEWQDPCNNHREKIKVLLYEKGMTSKEIVERLCDVYKNEHVDLETLLYWAIQIGYNK